MTPGQTVFAMTAHGVRALVDRCQGVPDLHVLAECAPLMGPVADITQDDEPLFDVFNGIAIIPVRGVLVDRTRWVGSDWVTGYNVLRMQLETAFGDENVEGIALLINSAGGMAAGLFDFVDWALAAKAEAGKPIGAICDDESYSAAYAVALIADSIAVPQIGGVGSIGAYILHMEMSKWLEEIGDTYTFIRAGKRKADANWIEPLPPEAKADLQADVDALREMFAQRVAAARGIDFDVVMGTEARAFAGIVGVKEAVALGLADAIVSPAEAFKRLRDFVAEQRTAA